MNTETAQSTFPTSTSSGSPGLNGGTGSPVHRVAQKAHEAVDKLEQTIGTGSEKVAGWQQEYGGLARDQIKANPLAAVGVAFAVGFILAKLSR